MEGKAPGAKPHTYTKCPSPHIIRPGLYAYWTKAPEPLREYVSEKVEFEWSSVGGFTKWLTGALVQYA